ncbi:MATE family efflux transporter [Clostridiaceae bacterium NSJ-31]|uniref:MATE family efflux transporter n=1 Tax=Ligaoa zhengdingensis TaxID=2763658 RepID=A0A926DXU2_9FIRM|nr:MATE family efflux transporter [Ligaoa zhengdingensis]MBC8545414.1 MATE family efflux transporter [Ligaoa zhengdingensis]
MNDLEAYNRRGAMFHLTWPIFIELTLQMLVGNMDQMMVSQYSQNSVGAIGNANQILNVLLLTFSVISMASTILVSQYLGSGNQRRVAETYTIAIVVNLAFSLIVSVILVGFHEPIYRLMQVPDALMEESSQYISTIGSCISLQAIFLTFSAFFRSNAWMKESMYVSVAINLLNIAGNAILIPRIGVVGAAISSNISRLLGVVLIVFIFVRKSSIHISLRYLKPFPRRQLKSLLAIGLPSGGESLSYNMTQIVIMSFANTFGTVTINTKVYASMFAMLSFLYASAIGQAQQIVVGYFIGAKMYDDAYHGVRRTLRSAVGVSLCISLLLFAGSNLIFGIFTSDPQVIALGRIIMGIEVVLEFGRAMNIVLVRALQGTGDIKFPTLIGVLCQWGIAVGGSFLFGIVFQWGLVGIWAAMALDECTRGVIFLIRWKSGKWRTKGLINA